MKDFKIELIQENQILEFTFNKDKPGRFDGEIYGMDISSPENGYITTIGGKLTGSLLASVVNGLTGNVSKIRDLDKIVYLVRAYNKGDFFHKRNEVLVTEYNYDKLIDRCDNTSLIKNDILKLLFIYFIYCSPLVDNRS